MVPEGPAHLCCSIIEKIVVCKRMTALDSRGEQVQIRNCQLCTCCHCSEDTKDNTRPLKGGHHIGLAAVVQQCTQGVQAQPCNQSRRLQCLNKEGVACDTAYPGQE